ncbi:MAG: hypothetical protein HFK06_01525 [Clostridia bacterium]|jgi:hypothetical protein|uniref:phosphoribosyltransferase-like protein n=1 Tax=Dubosiella newyorkensis TaxID=1862672 RepID=UPI0025ABBE4D|nr:hypothetical protein [Dubosiella newyorkensis]MCI9407018.1 hypothetical protein [Clostridia bacterium]
MSDEIKDKIKYHTFTKRWGNNKLCRAFAKEIDSWLNNFDEQEQKLLLELLKHFDYYIDRRLYSKAIELYTKFQTICNEDKTKIAFCRIPKEYKVGFSDIFATCFWYANDLLNAITTNIIDLILDSGITPSTLVVVDDVSGSATSFKKLLDAMKKAKIDLTDCTIYFLAINITQFAITNIENYAESKGLTIIPVYLDTQKKAFDPDYIFKDASAKQSEFESLSAKYGVNNVLGFKQAEALISFEYNTPNDTLGIFYEDVIDSTLFKRKNRKENTCVNSMSIRATQLKKVNQANVVHDNTDYFKELSVFVYAYAWGKNFSFIKACQDLGLTEKQLFNIFSILSNNGFIEYVDGSYQLTSKGKQFVHTSNIKEVKAIYSDLSSKSVVPQNNEASADKYIPLNFAEKFKGYN